MIKITVTFQMEEEQLRELFEANEVKFTKKKAKELQNDLEYTSEDIQIGLEDGFAEIVSESIHELFE